MQFTWNYNSTTSSYIFYILGYLHDFGSYRTIHMVIRLRSADESIGHIIKYKIIKLN